MPSNVFATTGTNVSVLFFDNSKKTDKVILIDASKMGEDYQDGKNKKCRLRPFEIDEIVNTFNNKESVDDFSVAVTYDEIKKKKYSLSAGQYFDVKIEYVELTQEELANKVNVRRETIARLENAKYNPSLELAVRISNELNIPLEKLFVFEF